MALAFDPYAPEFLVDPYRVYRRMLREGPVHTTISGFKVVCRYEECARMLMDPAWGTDPSAVDPVRLLFAAEEPEGPPLTRVDPPEHTVVRRLFGAPFSRSAMSAIEPVITRHLDDLLDELGDRGVIDVMAELAVPLTTRVICELLGVPREMEGDVVVWAARVSEKIELDRGPPEAVARQVEATVALRGLVTELVGARRACPRDDLLSVFTSAAIGGRQLTDAELSANVALLMMSAQETSSALIGNGLVALFQHPDQLARLRDDPSIDECAIEELARYDPPAQTRPRVALVATEIGGVPIQQGEQVLVLLGAANRDERAFAEPDALDVARNPNHHIAFGIGRHLCFGANLARLEARVAVTRVIRQFPDARPTVSRFEHLPRFALRRPSRLPLTLRTSRASASRTTPG